MPELMLNIFNVCLCEHILPQRRKTQELILLRKDAKPLEKPASYRPICLTDTIGKLFERLFVQRVENYIDASGRLFPRQFGCRKGRSTVYAIKNVMDTAQSVIRCTR